MWEEVQNDIFKNHGLENRVDSVGINPQEHIGPIRMRSVLNQAADRNEAKRIAEIEHLNNGSAVLDKVTNHMSVFSRGDLVGVLCRKVRIFSQGVSNALLMRPVDGEVILN
jgi:hypothetical protein